MLTLQFDDVTVKTIYISAIKKMLHSIEKPNLVSRMNMSGHNSTLF